VKESN